MYTKVPFGTQNYQGKKVKEKNWKEIKFRRKLKIGLKVII